jgi:UDP-N-acetylmuramoyl-L-alanyl-D-glutamate--2,6-diaminopimelate ligase
MRAEALRRRLETAGLLHRWPEPAPDNFTGVTTDSRRVSAGFLFIAYTGTTSDGHSFAPAAAAAGATAVMVERRLDTLSAPQIVVRDGRHAASVAGALFHGDPVQALDLIAVTGTNGKTTTTHIMRHLFGDVAPAGLIGTLGARDGSGVPLPGTDTLTTPGPIELQEILAQLRGMGVRTVAMEASSHALDQDRLWGLTLRAAVYTYVARDHLDYHETWDKYVAAKLRLSDCLAADGWEIVNAAEDAWKALPPRTNRLTFGVDRGADVRATGVEGDLDGMRFTLAVRGEKAAVRLPLVGAYNVENALAAAATAIAMGRGMKEVAARLESAPQVPGRMERLADRPCLVLRDYAHTADAFERVLTTLRSLTGGRLIILFGCGGDRDRGKRPLMGRAAATHADLVVLTMDNPRTEDVNRILDDIEEGMGDTPHLRVVDRRQAIMRAVSIAKPGDILLLAGKGHETYQAIGTERVPFDEREVVAEVVGALAER